MNYQSVIGGIAVLIGLIGYVPYFRNIILGKTKPHAFSWLVWGTLTAIAFFAQISAKGGAGTWVTGFTALVCFAICVLALHKGTRDFSLTDWICLIGAAAGLALWGVTKNALTAVVLVTTIDMVGFIPTFTKSYARPHEETLFTYTMSGAKFVVGIAALSTFNLTTVLYPASLVVTNALFIAMTLVRRKNMI